jgi:tetratricopeptide (TPR) repeat protein
VKNPVKEWASPVSDRLAELQRRVQFDTAPFVFAQLAEEYCRAGRNTDAVACCRTGLSHHPGYLSLRLILARALVGLAKWDEAAAEYHGVVTASPDNLAATRELAAVLEGQGRKDEALALYRRALALARQDKALEASIAALAPAPEAPDHAPVAPRTDFDAVLTSIGHPHQQPPPVIEMLLTDPMALLPRGPATPAGLSSEVEDEFARLERDLRERTGEPMTPPATPAVMAAAPDPVSTPPLAAASIDAAMLADLEAWLDVLVRVRAGSLPS